MHELEAYLIEQAALCEIAVTEEQARAFFLYLTSLLEWNEKINLTAITDPKEAVMKHFVDSLYLTRFLELRGKTLLDVGTGAGFPGIPLKLYEPGLSVTLLDGLQKRLNVLGEICGLLKIQTERLHGRAEEAGRTPELRAKFDLVTARAVAQLPVLCEYCLPFLKMDGVFCAMKGPSPEEEVESAKHAIRELGCTLERVETYALPNGEGRSAVLIRRTGSLPAKYPRGGGKIKKQPL